MPCPPVMHSYCPAESEPGPPPGPPGHQQSRSGGGGVTHFAHGMQRALASRCPALERGRSLSPSAQISAPAGAQFLHEAPLHSGPTCLHNTGTHGPHCPGVGLRDAHRLGHCERLLGATAPGSHPPARLAALRLAHGSHRTPALRSQAVPTGPRARHTPALTASDEHPARASGADSTCRWQDLAAFSQGEPSPRGARRA